MPIISIHMAAWILTTSLSSSLFYSFIREKKRGKKKNSGTKESWKWLWRIICKVLTGKLSSTTNKEFAILQNLKRKISPLALRKWIIHLYQSHQSGKTYWIDSHTLSSTSKLTINDFFHLAQTGKPSLVLFAEHLNNRENRRKWNM